MLNAGGNKGKTERRGRKAEPRKQAAGQQGFEAEPRPDAQEQINEQIGAPVASIDQLQDAQEQVNEQISAPVAWSDISPLETSATDIIPTVPAVSAEPVVAQPCNDRQCLWRLHREIGPTDLVLSGEASGRAVAR
jgi:hypothetical protein